MIIRNAYFVNVAKSRKVDDKGQMINQLEHDKDKNHIVCDPFWICPSQGFA